MADIGAGVGFFSSVAVEIVSKASCVAAFDISPEMVSEPKKRIELAKIKNISASLSE